MGTRGGIVRYTDGEAGAFAGAYHHWDSYPSALGATLFRVIRGHFMGDLEAATAFLIDAHPAGWSTINDGDFALPAGFLEREPDCAVCGKSEYDRVHWENNALDGYVAPKGNHRFVETPHGPRCYCHGERAEEGQLLTQANATRIGCEWLYALGRTEDGRPFMDVLASYNEDGTKAIGFAGSGNPNAEWACLARVMLDEDEPFWGNIGRGA